MKSKKHLLQCFHHLILIVSRKDYHIACSDSAGCITIYELEEGLKISSQWSAHGYEAWITAFHHFNNKIVYSGK